MSFKFFKKLNIKLRRLSFENCGYGLFGVIAIGFALFSISTFNKVIKQAEMDKEVAQLTAAKSHRDQLYDDLIELVYFEMFDKEHLDDERFQRFYKENLWVVFNSIATLFSDSRYKTFIQDIKSLREMSLNLRLSSLPVSSELVKQKDFSIAEKASKEAFDDIFSLIEEDYKVLVKDVLNLPVRSYKRFLSLLDKLRGVEKPSRSKALK